MNSIKSSTKQPDMSPKVLKATWNPWWGIVFTLLVFFVSQLIAGLLVSIYPALQHWSKAHANNWLTNDTVAQFIYVLLAESLSVGAIYAFLKRRKLSLAFIGLKRPRWIDPGYAVLGFAGYFVLYIAEVAVVQAFVPHLNVNQQQQIGFNDVHGVLALSLTFISLVILPPIAEEIMVRGFLYSSLKKILPTAVAVVATSALFASAHLPEGGSSGPLWIAGLDTFVLSLVLIYLREKTGSLWPCMMLHAIKNGVAFSALYLVHIH